jgi:hypothetical protein
MIYQLCQQKVKLSVARQAQYDKESRVESVSTRVEPEPHGRPKNFPVWISHLLNPLEKFGVEARAISWRFYRFLQCLSIGQDG